MSTQKQYHATYLDARKSSTQPYCEHEPERAQGLSPNSGCSSGCPFSEFETFKRRRVQTDLYVSTERGQTSQRRPCHDTLSLPTRTKKTRWLCLCSSCTKSTTHWHGRMYVSAQGQYSIKQICIRTFVFAKQRPRSFKYTSSRTQPGTLPAVLLQLLWCSRHGIIH